MSLLDLTRCVAFDVETQGDEDLFALQPFRHLQGAARVSAATFAWVEAPKTLKTDCILYPQNDWLQANLDRFSGRRMVAWNAVFDAAWLIALGFEKEVFAYQWLDPMLLWRHAVVEPEGDEIPKAKRKSYALEAAMHEFFPEFSDFKDFKDFQATDAEALKGLLNRNRMDTIFTVKFAEMFWNMLDDRQQRAALLEAACIPMVAKTRILGITANNEAAQSLQIALTKEYDENYRKLLEIYPQIVDVNLGSSPQLATLFFDTWGLPCLKQTKPSKTKPEGSRSTDKYVLYDLAATYPEAALVKNCREAKNNTTKYAVATQKSLEYNGDGCIRPEAKVFSTYTGRMSYGSKQGKGKAERPVGIALHQMKRGKDFRRLIAVPEGYTLEEFDFSGQEFRWMAVASKDETMLSLCAPGEDAHSYMGAQIALVDYRQLIERVHAEDKEAENQRKLGKFSNLSFQYRISAAKATVKARVEYGLDVNETFIGGVQSTYKRTYPGILDYWRNQVMKCKQVGYAETYAGRRVQLKGSWVGRDKWGLESTAINYPIQGTGADQKYLALAVLRNYLPQIGGYFYFELHDGLFLLIPTHKAQTEAVKIKHMLSNLPYKEAWGVDLPIQFPVDAKLSDQSWGDLKELKV
jgi:DNA polymerase I-like protein with 3'-5' exonuclease and polymerase domains